MISIKEGYDSRTDDDEFLLPVLHGAIAQKERKTTTGRVKVTQVLKAKEGKTNIPQPAYGYMLSEDRQHLVVNPPIYQIDRYHLKRELRDLLCDAQHLENGLAAVDKSDVDTLTEVLRKARKEVQDPAQQAKIKELLAAIREMPEAFREYRVRLEEMGYDTHEMRGMGATESNVNKFSKRLKKRGQSWGLEGLKAMIHSIVKYFEDKLDRYAEHVSRLHNILIEEKTTQVTEEIISKVTTDIYEGKRGRIPLLSVGASRSGGYPRSFGILLYQILS